jgi:hypothetical protein
MVPINASPAFGEVLKRTDALLFFIVWFGEYRFDYAAHSLDTLVPPGL